MIRSFENSLLVSSQYSPDFSTWFKEAFECAAYRLIFPLVFSSPIVVHKCTAESASAQLFRSVFKVLVVTIVVLTARMSFVKSQLHSIALQSPV